MLGLVAIAISHPASGGLSSKLGVSRSHREEDTLLVPGPTRPSAIIEQFELEEQEGADEEEDADDFSDSPSTPAVKKSSAKGKQRPASSAGGPRSGRRRKRKPPSTVEQISTQASSFWSSVSDRTSKLKGSVTKAMEERNRRLAIEAEHQRKAKLRERAEVRARQEEVCAHR